MITIVLVVLFFVSGADANTFVLGMLTTRGCERPPAGILALWGVLTGLAAMTLLVVGGLESLQQMVIVSSAPFLVIVTGIAVAFWRDISREPHVPKAVEATPFDAATPSRTNGNLVGSVEPAEISVAATDVGAVRAD